MLRVLVVGCGNIAGGFDAARPEDAWPLTHAGAFRRHGGFRLAACVDPDPARRAAFSERWGLDEAHPDLRALAGKQGAFDVISICSPTANHAADIEAAIALRPKLVFCEKPVTTSVSATERAVSACRDAGILLAVNHTRRWAPDISRLRDELAAGRWGAVRSLAGRYSKGVLNNGAHMTDLLLNLLGPLRVAWAGAPVDDFWPNDPTVPFTLVSDAGVPVLVGVGHAADYATFELTIVAERGVVAMEDGGTAWRVREAIDSPTFAGYKALEPGAATPGFYDRAMTNAAANIHEAITREAPLLSTGETALAAQRLCDDIRTAAGRPAQHPGPEA